LDATVAVDDTTPETQLTAAITLGTNSVVGVAGSTTLTLTPPKAMAATDTIVFTMPTNFSVPQGSITLTDAVLDGGTFTCSGVSATRVITCVVASGAVTGDSAGNLVMSGILALWNSADATNVADLTINDVAAGGGLDIGLDATVAVDDTTVGALSSTNVEPTTLSPGSPSANTISFTTVTAIPNLGKILITYPTGYNVANVNGITATSLSGLDGTWTATVSGQVITLTQTGGGATSAGAKSLVLATGVVTPGTVGATGTYTITTATSSASLTIETNAAVTADTIVSYSSDSGGGGGGGSSSSSRSTTTTTTSTTATTTATEEEAATTEESTATDESATTEEGATSEESSSGGTSEPVTIITESGTEITLTDVSDHWGVAEIEAMVEQEIVKGDEETGTFRPNDNLNRAEASALLYRVLGLEEPTAPDANPLSDVEIDQWFAGYIAELKTRGIVTGNPDGTYRPANNMNRAEFLELAMKTYYSLANEETKAEIDALKAGDTTDAYSDLKGTEWYAPTVTAATSYGFISGKACGEAKCFDAGANITRAEATKILYNMFYGMLTEEAAVVEEEVVTEETPAE
jgi:hypothetical protein